MNNIACFICHKPNEVLRSFIESNQPLGYTFCVLVDDNTWKKTKKWDKVDIIQIEESVCANYSPTYDDDFIKVRLKGRCGGWSKAMYHFSQLKGKWDHVWFIEDDVFLENARTLVDIDIQYEKSDVLVSNMIREQCKWEHWPKNKEYDSFSKSMTSFFKLKKLKMHHTMHCSVRLSSNILQRIGKFVEKYKRLYFLEYFIPTFAHCGKYTIRHPREMHGIHWNTVWKKKDIEKGHMYHPVKETSVQNQWRTEGVSDLIDELISPVHLDAEKRTVFLKAYDTLETYRNSIGDKKWDADKTTNPLYPKFNQMLYTAGDEDQVNRRVFIGFLRELSDKIRSKASAKEINDFWNRITVFRKTFGYLFHEFKKGIIVVIRNNTLQTFLPFSNANYRNKFYVNLGLDTQDERELRDIMKLEERIENEDDMDVVDQLRRQMSKLSRNNAKRFRVIMKQYGFDARTNTNRWEWYGNNCLLRNEWPKYEGDKLYNVYLNFFEELVKNEKVDDCEFFLNIRDFPVLCSENKDGTRNQPYNYVFPMGATIDKKYNGDHARILGYASAEGFDDIVIPCADDWAIATNKLFLGPGEHYLNFKDLVRPEWKDKLNKATFYGSATGCGTTEEDNLRIRMAEMGQRQREYFEVYLTNANARVKVDIHGAPKFKRSNAYSLSRSITTKRQSLEEKAAFKYILNLDGHVSANRLLSEFGMGSLVLYVDSSKYKCWARQFIKEGVHYKSIREDLSNVHYIMKKGKRAKTDEEYRKISDNGMKLFSELTTVDFQLRHVADTLNTVHEINSTHKWKKTTSLGVVAVFRARGESRSARNKQCTTFIHLMRNLLSLLTKEMCIYIIEQVDDKPFNIGALKNIGFDVSKRKHDYYLFTDIDAIPDDELLLYHSSKIKNSPMLMAHRGIRYNKYILPMSVYFSREDFVKTGGYPMNFFGWGGEDDLLGIRSYRTLGKYKYIPRSGRIIDIEMDADGERLDVVKKKKQVENEIETRKWEKVNAELEKKSANDLKNISEKYTTCSKICIHDNVFQYKIRLTYDEKIDHLTTTSVPPKYETLAGKKY